MEILLGFNVFLKILFKAFYGIFLGKKLAALKYVRSSLLYNIIHYTVYFQKMYSILPNTATRTHWVEKQG